MKVAPVTRVGSVFIPGKAAPVPMKVAPVTRLAVFHTRAGNSRYMVPSLRRPVSSFGAACPIAQHGCTIVRCGLSHRSGYPVPSLSTVVPSFRAPGTVAQHTRYNSSAYPVPLLKVPGTGFVHMRSRWKSNRRSRAGRHNRIERVHCHRYLATSLTNSARGRNEAVDRKWQLYVQSMHVRNKSKKSTWISCEAVWAVAWGCFPCLKTDFRRTK